MNILDIRNVINSTKFNNSNVDIIKFNGQEVWTAGYWLTKTGYPLTLTNSLGKKLKDYKIYGNSIRIIDKTGNIFDGNMQQGMYLYTNGTYLFVQNYICSTNRVAIEQNTKYYINVIYSGNDTLSGKIIYYGEDGSFVSYAVIDNLGTNSFTTESNASYMALDICKTSGANITVDEIEDITISKTPISVEMKDFGDKTDNLIDYKQFTPYTARGITLIENGVEYTGSYYIVAIADNLISGDTYVMGFNMESEDKLKPYWRFQYTDKTYSKAASNGVSITIPTDKTVEKVLLYPEISATIHTTKITNIQLLQGSTVKPYEPQGYRIPVKVSGINKLNTTLQSQTIYGVTYSRNNDGTYVANGTSTSNNCMANIGTFDVKAGKTYRLLGAPNIRNTYMLTQITNADDTKSWVQTSYSGGNFTPEVDQTITVRLRAYLGVILDNAIYKPMVTEVLTTKYDDYEPYVEPSITNIYLDEPLRKVGSTADYIDFANQKIVRNVKVENGTYSQLTPPLEQTVNLPEVMTIKGTCILSCDTALVPSNMSATYKSSKNI